MTASRAARAARPPVSSAGIAIVPTTSGAENADVLPSAPLAVATMRPPFVAAPAGIVATIVPPAADMSRGWFRLHRCRLKLKRARGLNKERKGVGFPAVADIENARKAAAVPSGWKILKNITRENAILNNGLTKSAFSRTPNPDSAIPSSFIPQFGLPTCLWTAHRS